MFKKDVRDGTAIRYTSWATLPILAVFLALIVPMKVTSFRSLTETANRKNIFINVADAVNVSAIDALCWEDESLA